MLPMCLLEGGNKATELRPLSPQRGKELVATPDSGPELSPWDSGRRELIPASCSLTSTYVPWHAHMHATTQTIQPRMV